MSTAINESFEDEHGISDKSPKKKYNHRWSYAAGRCVCINKECGMAHPHYLIVSLTDDNEKYPHGYVSSTPGGRGKVLEVLTEASDVYTELGDAETLLEGFMNHFPKCFKDNESLEYLSEEFREDHTVPRKFVDIPGKVKDKSIDDLGMLDKKGKTNIVSGGPIHSVRREGKAPPDTKQAELAMGTLGRSIISGKGKVSQATMNTISNLINNNGLIGKWSRSGNRDFKRIKVDLAENTKLDIEFVPPNNIKSPDFINRYVNGKESIGKFLRRSPDIHVRISNKVFREFTKGEQLNTLMKDIVQWYDYGIEECADDITQDLLKSGNTVKQLVATTPLMGLLTLPLSMLLIFDNVTPSEKSDNKYSYFIDDGNSIRDTVTRFYRTMKLSPTASKEEQQKVLDDLKEAIFHVSKLATYGEFVQSYQKLPEAIQTWCEGGYENTINEIEERWIAEQCESKIFTEAPKVKKLKKIPNDIIAYVLIEGEAIRDANDKFLIVSYLLGKLEIVDWYIELLDVGSTRYIVPHSKAHLVNLRTQMLAAYQKIMAIRIPSPNDPTVRVDYPQGYEG